MFCYVKSCGSKFAHLKILFLAFMCACSLAEPLEKSILQCKSACSEKSTVVMFRKNQQLTCAIKNVDKYPWPESKDKTATKPKNLRVKWYIYDNKRIALNITWLQRASELAEGYIDGYFLIVHLVKYELDLQLNRSSLANKTSHKNHIQFTFPCFGIRRSMFAPGENIKVILYSKPMHHEESHEQDLKRNITIPTCVEDERLSSMRNREISTRRCKIFWEKKRNRKYLRSTQVITTQDPITVIVHQPFTDHTIYYALASVIGAFLVIAILLKMIQNSKQETKNKYREGVKILMVTSTRYNEELESIHGMVTKLRDRYHLEIICNWEKQSDISVDPMAWYSQTTEKTNMIVFVVNYECFKHGLSVTDNNNIDAELKQAMNFANARSLISKSDIVYLLTGRISTAQMIWARQKTYHKVYSISQGLNDFLKYVMRKDTRHHRRIKQDI